MSRTHKKREGNYFIDLPSDDEIIHVSLTHMYDVAYVRFYAHTATII